MSGADAPAVGKPPTPGRLPDGFTIQLDPRVRRLNDGQALLGGSPIRLLRLSAVAAALLVDAPTLRVRNGTTAALARRLLDTGVAHPRPDHAPDHRAVTAVIPVRDRPEGLDRLLAAVRQTTAGIPIVVVDDGSRDALAVRRVCARHAATVIRHDVARGPATARNAGLAAATTPYIALVDSDCVPLAGWLDPLLGHLADPQVAAVAPRIIGVQAARSGWLASYEAAASSLDLGVREGPVHPHAGVPYLPSAALLVRRAALGAGYDETLHVAEDVDLVWRLVAAGWRVRYVPAARVAHEHRTTVAAWARRRTFYGTGAAGLAARHGSAVAPVVLSPWSAAAWIALCLGRRRGPVAAALVLAWATARLAGRLTDVGPAWPLAARLVGLGTAYAGRQLASAVVRHYWPVSLVAALASRRWRRIVAVAAAVDGVVGWWPHRHDVALPGFVLIRRLDDLCYGAGLWWGAGRARSQRALRPTLGSPEAR